MQKVSKDDFLKYSELNNVNVYALKLAAENTNSGAYAKYMINIDKVEAVTDETANICLMKCLLDVTYLQYLKFDAVNATATGLTIKKTNESEKVSDSQKAILEKEIIRRLKYKLLQVEKMVGFQIYKRCPKTDVL